MPTSTSSLALARMRLAEAVQSGDDRPAEEQATRLAELLALAYDARLGSPTRA